MYSKFFKRLFDIIFSFLLIVILSPLFIILSIYVAVFLGTPILFFQERIGKGEKPFKLMKFRTMTNKKDGNGVLLPESQRLTKAGKFLRNTSIDELPELLLILIGKMSFIGPRPLPTYYGPYFLQNERKRHSIRGGLITPDTLSGKTVTSYEEQFKYECDYADQVSFMLDVKIIIATFKVLFLRVEEDYGKCERPHLNVYRKDMLNG